MKNINKTLSVSLAVIILLAIIGGVYVYSQKTQFVINPILQTQIQNCGEIINSSSSDIVQQQKNTLAYTCMSKALLNCSPATIIEPYMNGKETFSILSATGNYCSISQVIGSSTKNITCNIPRDFITNSNQFFLTKNHPEWLSYLISPFFVPISTPTSTRPIIKDMITGKVITPQPCISD